MTITNEMTEAALRAFGSKPLTHSSRDAMRAAIEAALAAAPQGTPVAWRWKAVLVDHLISNWVLTHSEPPAYAVTQEPLYVLPPAADAPQGEPAYSYACRLAHSMYRRHYQEDISPAWKPQPDLLGVLTQIDNMVTGLVRRGEQK